MKNTEYGPNQNMKNGWLMIYTRIKPCLCILFVLIQIFSRSPINHFVQTAGILNNFIGILGFEPINWINSGSEKWANITVIIVWIVWISLLIIPSILCLAFSGIKYNKYVNLIKPLLFIDLFIVALLPAYFIFALLSIHFVVNRLCFVIVYLIGILVGIPTWYTMNVKYFKARIVNPKFSQ